jgi:hypothetical protein
MNKLFKIIDQNLFSLTDQFKSSSTYQQILTPIESLPDEVQTITNKSIAVLIPLIPIAVFIFVLIVNISKRNDLKNKIVLTQMVQKIDHLKNKQKQLENSHALPMNLTTKELLTNKINTMSTSSTIPSGKITISNYEQNKIGELGQSLATLNFSGISTKQLTKFLRQAVMSNKMKIKSIDIKKIQKLLKGELQIIYFSRGN